jgi:hypothetical protein
MVDMDRDSVDRESMDRESMVDSDRDFHLPGRAAAGFAYPRHLPLRAVLVAAAVADA